MPNVTALQAVFQTSAELRAHSLLLVVETPMLGRRVDSDAL